MHCTAHADVQHSLKRLSKARIEYCCHHCMRCRSSPASSGAGTRLPGAMASTQPCVTACVHGASHPGCTTGASPCFNIKYKPPSRARWLRPPRPYQDRPLPCSQARDGKERSTHTCSLRNAHQALGRQRVAPAPGGRPQVCRPAHGGKQTHESELALARHHALRTSAPLPCQGLAARVSDQTGMHASQTLAAGVRARARTRGPAGTSSSARCRRSRPCCSTSCGTCAARTQSPPAAWPTRWPSLSAGCSSPGAPRKDASISMPVSAGCGACP